MNGSQGAGDVRVAAFAAQVRAYVALIDDAEKVEPIELLRACSRILPRLYAEALELPDIESSDELEEVAVKSPFERLSRILAPVSLYWTVFDPYEKPDVELAGSLADDLAGIYLDLCRPLRDFDAGDIGNAVWAWRFNMKVHAGLHLLQGLHAIHWILHPRGWPEPSAPPASSNEAGQP
jgi:hypothetical protein